MEVVGYLVLNIASIFVMWGWVYFGHGVKCVRYVYAFVVITLIIMIWLYWLLPTDSMEEVEFKEKLIKFFACFSVMVRWIAELLSDIWEKSRKQKRKAKN